MNKQTYISYHFWRRQLAQFLDTIQKQLDQDDGNVLPKIIQIFVQLMPPKKGQKLTKKQIEEQKRQAARLQKQKEEEEAAAERERLEEEARIRQLERQKMLEEERVRIVEEKEKKYPQNEARIKGEKQAYIKMMEQQKWSHFTTPYSKDYSIDGTNLSTFSSIFKNFVHRDPKQTIEMCDDCEVYINKLQQKTLECRAEYDTAGEAECKKYIDTLQAQITKKMQQIMIQYANYGQEMQQKNVEQAKKKNQQNAVQKAIKPVDSIFEMSPNYKIGMYINTTSTKNYNKFNPLSIKEFGFNTEVPPKWTNNTAIVKFEWMNFNNYSPENQEQFRIIGGVFNLEFYDMFVGIKRTNNISIKKFYKGREILDKFKLPSSAIKEPFKIMYEIPPYVFLAPYNKNNIKMAQYDVTAGKWNILPNDSILEYLEAERRVNCKVSKPEPVALVENKCADYPYVAWQLRTVEQGKVLLDLQLRRSVPIPGSENNQESPLILQFEIGPNIMKLNMDQNYAELEDLREDYHTPQYMLWELSKRGIHLLPADQDYRYAGIKAKDREAEKNAIRDIAYAVESFSVRSQPNDSDEIRVKIRENLDHEFIFLEDQEKDWKKIRWGDRDKCSVANRGIELRHMDLETLLQEHDFCEKECHERMKYNREFLLRKTLIKVLELTRILSFTTADPEAKSVLVQKLKEKLIVE